MLGVQSLKPFQAKAINHILAKRDCVVRAPTGSGKSLIFWVIPLVLALPIVIVLPTNALIIDQKRKLGDRCKVIGAPRASLDEENGSNTAILYYVCLPEHIDKLCSELTQGDIRVALIVIDECHLVEEWGATFRKKFWSLGAVAARLSYCTPVVLALSATLPDSRLSTLNSLLMLDNPALITEPLNLTHLFFSFFEKSPYVDSALRTIITPILSDLKLLLENFPKTIIYANHSSIPMINNFLVNKLGSLLYGSGSTESPCRLVVQFHGQLEHNNQSEILKEFKKEKSRHRIIIASSAFGLGIDVRDVRRVVFVSPPKLTTELLQQLGRGGRDRQPTYIDLYWNRLERSHVADGMKKMLEAKCIRKELYSVYGDNAADPLLSTENCCSLCRESKQVQPHEE